MRIFSFIASLIIVVSFSSCTSPSVVFTQIQNVNGTELHEFPEALVGDWTGKLDTIWEFSENNPISFTKQSFSINNKVFTLGDSLKIYQNKDILILNKISETYSNKVKTYYEVYAFVVEQDSLNSTNNIFVHYISNQHLSVPYARRFHQSKSIEPLGHFAVASEGQAINYKLTNRDIQELHHIQPLLVFTDGHKIIPGNATDIGYECEPLPWKIRRKEKRIKRLMRN